MPEGALPELVLPEELLPVFWDGLLEGFEFEPALVLVFVFVLALLLEPVFELALPLLVAPELEPASCACCLVRASCAAWTAASLARAACRSLSSPW